MCAMHREIEIRPHKVYFLFLVLLLSFLPFVVMQPVLLSPQPAPTSALFVPLGLHVVMTALSNHAPRVNTHLKASGHARHALTDSAVPIHLHLQSPSSQPPPPLPRIVQQLNLQAHVSNHANGYSILKSSHYDLVEVCILLVVILN